MSSYFSKFRSGLAFFYLSKAVVQGTSRSLLLFPFQETQEAEASKHDPGGPLLLFVGLQQCKRQADPVQRRI